MRFWVVVAFRNRADLLHGSLRSIGEQLDEDFGVLIGDDASDDPDVPMELEIYSALHPDWYIHQRPKRLNVIGNQVSLIRSVDMAPEDVIVFLDGDDRFAHPHVLELLRQIYEDPMVDLTYGSYRPDPPDAGCLMARPIPTDVCEKKGGYRAWARGHGTAWNHLRTFRRRIFDAIPESHMKAQGRWLEGGADFAMMNPALELAGGRHRFIEDVLVIYTSDRLDAEWRSQTPGIKFTHRYIRRQRPLMPLPPMEV